MKKLSLIALSAIMTFGALNAEDAKSATQTPPAKTEVKASFVTRAMKLVQENGSKAIKATKKVAEYPFVKANYPVWAQNNPYKTAAIVATGSVVAGYAVYKLAQSCKNKNASRK